MRFVHGHVHFFHHLFGGLGHLVVGPGMGHNHVHNLTLRIRTYHLVAIKSQIPAVDFHHRVTFRFLERARRRAGGLWGHALTFFPGSYHSTTTPGLPRPSTLARRAAKCQDKAMDLLEKAVAGHRLDLEEIEALDQLPLSELAAAAHERRLNQADPRVVTYLIDRNINYSNVCTIGCPYCAFWRARKSPEAYVLSYEEISQKIAELEAVGGRRILMQGGVHPELPLSWYEDLLRYLKTHHPRVRIDAFSPEEILGLERLTGLPAKEILARLKDAGLDGMPGAGAEILVDAVRHRAAPRRIPTADWLRIVDAAQSLGLYTLASMVIGFGEGPRERAIHLDIIRRQQDKAQSAYGQGFAAFAMWTLQTEETAYRGHAPGATAHEYLKNLAIARLALDNIPNHQASWPTMGFRVAQLALHYGANDFGSTMLEENVVSAAGGYDRTRATVQQIRSLIREAGFVPKERDVYYNLVGEKAAETA